MLCVEQSIRSHDLGNSKDYIDDRAMEIFKRERPDEIWAIQALPRSGFQDVRASVSAETRQEYREKARLELETEGDG
jgi:hypothetical protein